MVRDGLHPYSRAATQPPMKERYRLLPHAGSRTTTYQGWGPESEVPDRKANQFASLDGMADLGAVGTFVGNVTTM
jgi:hypothetical protein